MIVVATQLTDSCPMQSTHKGLPSALNMTAHALRFG